MNRVDINPSLLNYDEYYAPTDDFKKWDCGLPLPDQSTGPTAVQFTDENILLVQLRKFTKYPAAEIRAATIDVMKNIHKLEVTEETIMKILRLALSLKSKSGKDVFHEHHDDRFKNIVATGVDSRTMLPKPNAIAGESDYISGLVGRASEASGGTTGNEIEKVIEDDPLIEYSGPYLACSFLRLINKEDTNWTRAIGAIKQQFGVFFGVTSNLITHYAPSSYHAKIIKAGFNTYKPLVRYFVLCTAHSDQNLETNSDSAGLFTYFAGQHLAFPGMHVYPMITALIRNMRGVSPGLLLTWLTVEETRDTIKMVYDMATTYDAPSGKNRKDRSFIWKYARNLNEGFFLQLQTKKNKELVYGLALLHKKRGLIAGRTYADPENMAVLQNQDTLKQDAEEFASIIIALYREAIAKREGATPVDQIRANLTRRAPIPKPLSGQPVSEPMIVTPTPLNRKRQHEAQSSGAPAAKTRTPGGISDLPY